MKKQKGIKNNMLVLLKTTTFESMISQENITKVCDITKRGKLMSCWSMVKKNGDYLDNFHSFFFLSF